MRAVHLWPTMEVVWLSYYYSSDTGAQFALKRTNRTVIRKLVPTLTKKDKVLSKSIFIFQPCSLKYETTVEEEATQIALFQAIKLNSSTKHRKQTFLKLYDFADCVCEAIKTLKNRKISTENGSYDTTIHEKRRSKNQYQNPSAVFLFPTQSFQSSRYGWNLIWGKSRPLLVWLRAPLIQLKGNVTLERHN